MLSVGGIYLGIFKYKLLYCVSKPLLFNGQKKNIFYMDEYKWLV